MKWIVACGLSTGFLLQVPALAQEITWENLPKLVQERNGRVASMHEKAKAAEALTGHTLRSFQPKIEITGGYEKGRQGTRSDYVDPFYGIEGRLNLFASGRDSQESKLRDARARLAEGAARMSEAEVLFEVRKLFLDWLVADSLVRAYGEAKTENDKGAKSASRRISRGVGTTTDRIEFELHDKELHQTHESLQHEKLILQILIGGLLRLEDPEKLEIKGDLEHFHDEKLLSDLSADVAQAPSVLVADASQSESSALASQGARWWMPSVDLYAGHYQFPFRQREFPSAFERTESAVGVELKLTLWDAPSFASSKSRSFFESAQRLDTLQTRHEMNARVRAQQEDMKHAHEILHLLEDRKSLNLSYLRQSLSEYDRGVKQSPDVLVAFQRSLKFQEELSRARYDYRLAQAKLLKDLGK